MTKEAPYSPWVSTSHLQKSNKVNHKFESQQLSINDQVSVSSLSTSHHSELKHWLHKIRREANTVCRKCGMGEGTVEHAMGEETVEHAMWEETVEQAKGEETVEQAKGEETVEHTMGEKTDEHTMGKKQLNTQWGRRQLNTQRSREQLNMQWWRRQLNMQWGRRQLNTQWGRRQLNTQWGRRQLNMQRSRRQLNMQWWRRHLNMQLGMRQLNMQWGSPCIQQPTTKQTEPYLTATNPLKALELWELWKVKLHLVAISHLGQPTYAVIAVTCSTTTSAKDSQMSNSERHINKSFSSQTPDENSLHQGIFP